ncbi:hypothetical protein ACJRO7_002047 [Eucalyptus globulus]|uniref:Uncharacterized protein n=1 Tax=Eucalyptus globulus TaxID=34317 RepID=A0ABD3LWB0_EUCGL
MMELGGSFRLQGRRSLSKLGRSNSSLLLSESVSAECSRIAGYERLSESMRLSTDPGGGTFGLGRDGSRGRTGGRVATFLTRVFGFGGRAAGRDERQRRREAEERGAAATAVRKRSSWLPDPDRRWPVQGW